jgi:hypothetical protein
MAFDFDAAEADDNDEQIRAVVAEISGTALKTPTPEEIAQREAERYSRREENIQREAQWRLEHEREQAAKQEAAQRERAIAAQEAREKAQRKRLADIERGVQSYALNALQLHAKGQERRQAHLDNALQQSARQQITTTLMEQLERELSTPKAEPDNFAARYRQNQRSGLYYTDTEE